MKCVRTEKELIEKLNSWALKRNIEFVRDDYYDINSFSINENVLTLTHDSFFIKGSLDYFIIKELYNTFSPANITIEVNGRDDLDVNIIFESDILLE